MQKKTKVEFRENSFLNSSFDFETITKKENATASGILGGLNG